MQPTSRVILLKCKSNYAVPLHNYSQGLAWPTSSWVITRYIPLVSLQGLALSNFFQHPPATVAFPQLFNVPWPSPTAFEVFSPLPAALLFPSPTSGIRILHSAFSSQCTLPSTRKSPITVTWRLSTYDDCVFDDYVMCVNLCFWWMSVNIIVVRIMFPSFSFTYQWILSY